ncbi:hypothetical protein EV426DRAFT_632998 [Tirmania nivea]|nr:hypothetical protein EV426DRAFT_632998 [Tirmania nivea]
MSESRLEVGSYDIYCESDIQVSDERWDGIRARDGKCVISGIVNRMAPSENLWIHERFGRWITDMDDMVGVSKINSCQNGFLLSRNVHGESDQYFVSVNPDEDMLGIDGRTLDLVCWDPQDPHRGEPVFEHDFPPGTDMVKEISEGPYAKERFELELSARLHGVC